ncbi:MAG: lipopolysaccharide heptosyltransferase II [Candidatus Brocadiia bacterium]
MTRNPESLIVRAPNWLGDCIMALPAMRAFHERLPEIPVDVICRPAVADLFSLVPFVREVIVVPRARGIRQNLQKFSLLKSLALRRYDAAVLLPNSISSAIEMKIVHPHRAFGFRADARSLLISDAIPRPAWEESAHLSSYYLEVFNAAMGIPPSGSPPVCDVSPLALKFPKKDIDEATRLLRSIGVLGEYATMATGTAYGPTRQWSVESYSELARELARRWGIAVLLMGAKSDRPHAFAVSQASGDLAKNICGDTTLSTAGVILRGARAFIGNDSGLSHYSALVGCPTVTLYLSTDPVRTGALGKRVAQLIADVPCRPCFAKESRYNYRCRSAITVDDALEAMETVILRHSEQEVS